MSYRPRKMRRLDDHGLDDWLMTYADMITLLLCFFAVFLAFSVPKAEQFELARKEMLERFSGTEHQVIVLPEMPIKSSKDGPYDATPGILDQEDPKTGDAPKRPEGDRIVTLEMPSAAFFGSGSATLSADGQALLLKIVQENLSGPEAQDYIITIEGHTDDEPIKTLQFPSNWELSTSRAASVVRFLIEHGIPAQRLRAAGYADSFPKAPNRDSAGKAIPANQAQNRRVLIKLEKIIKEENNNE